MEKEVIRLLEHSEQELMSDIASYQFPQGWIGFALSMRLGSIRQGFDF
jgi:hypothetical protein